KLPPLQSQVSGPFSLALDSHRRDRSATINSLIEAELVSKEAKRKEGWLAIRSTPQITERAIPDRKCHSRCPRDSQPPPSGQSSWDEARCDSRKTSFACPVRRTQGPIRGIRSQQSAVSPYSRQVQAFTVRQCQSFTDCGHGFV